MLLILILKIDQVLEIESIEYKFKINGADINKIKPIKDAVMNAENIILYALFSASFNFLLPKLLPTKTAIDVASPEKITKII
jgi:hypothetical protein